MELWKAFSPPAGNGVNKQNRTMILHLYHSDLKPVENKQSPLSEKNDLKLPSYKALICLQVVFLLMFLSAEN